MSTILDRIADASGIIFLLLVGVGYAVLVAPFSPQSLVSPAEVVTFLHTHPLDWRFPLGLAMELIGLLALVVFAARLAGRIRAVSRPESWTPAAVVAFAVLSAAVKVASFGPALVARKHTDSYDSGAITALFDLNEAAYDLSWALDGIFAIMLGLAALAARAMPRWLAAWAIVAGAAIEVGLAVPALFNNLQIAFLLWLVASSGWALRDGLRPAPVSRQDATAAVSV
jgi:hypothetical protein